MEETKHLLTDFVEMKSQYTTDKTIEIIVNHVIVPQNPPTAKEVIGIKPEASIAKVLDDTPIDYIDREIQTDFIDFSKYREPVDVMDVATGADKPIASYRSIAVLADFRHPVQDVLEALQMDYAKLEIDVI